MKRHSIIYMTLLLSFFCAALSAREPLTFEQRVKAQEAIEKVYYNHRIWPKENKPPKPPFEKMVSKETIEAKVSDYLKKSAVLEKYWYRPLTGEQLQAEMDRMAKGTKDPATLNELFEALNNDPYLIAECLVRPVLADRLVRNWYANDERFHKETREKAEEALIHLTPENFCSYSEGQYSKMTYRLENEPNEEREMLDPKDHSIGLDEAEFAKMFQEIPEEGKISGVIEKDDCFVILHTVEKNEGEIETECVMFKKTSVEELFANKKYFSVDINGVSTFLFSLSPSKMFAGGCDDGWDNGILDGAPDPRWGHTAVWTGTEMIVWGGDRDNYPQSGWRYDPSTDTWTPTAIGSNCALGRTSHTAVWTGTEMIVWGGTGIDYPFPTNTGGRYNPLSDVWVATSIGVNCPLPRWWHTAVWTGTEMIVWGGGVDMYPYNTSTGGRYNPNTDSWTETSIGSNCPTSRTGHTAVWTGSKMIIWGGAGEGYQNSGGKYDPTTDSWTATSTGVNCPESRTSHSAVWTGTEMIIWGGVGMNTGGRYNPITDAWLPTSIGTNCPSGRENFSTVWTGTEMIVWGGYNSLNDGGRYKPSTDSWTATSTGDNCPDGRGYHSAVWTGAEMIIWGGSSFSGGNYNTGGRYDPSTNTWVPTSTGPETPSNRNLHSAIWTGSEMIVWGGHIYWMYDYFLNSGGRYFPSTDSWLSTSTGDNCPVGRFLHSAVWTGTEMIVWGGEWQDATHHYENTGGRYNPLNDTWTLTSTTGDCPLPREEHTAVWTGTEMIIWGGDVYSGGDLCFDTGGRYNPTSDTWTATSTATGCPSARTWHTAVWTGTEMIIWGGGSYQGGAGANSFNTGGRYNPSTNSWTTTSTGGSCPSARYSQSAVWTGQEMIVWGGKFWDNGSTFYYNTGGRYNPSTNTWTATPTGSSCPDAREGHTAVWADSEMIIWGGYAGGHSNSGGRYITSQDAWSPTSTVMAPSGRSDHSAVWTGSHMIIWGGRYDFNYVNSGGRYYPGSLIKPVIEGLEGNTCPVRDVSLSIPDRYSVYQWNLNNSPISGATSSTHKATISGDYTVSVTDANDCSSTSEPHMVAVTPCLPEIMFAFEDSIVQVTGDGDWYHERGEKWSVEIGVTNNGNTPATNVTAMLSGNGITVCNNPGTFGTIQADGGTSFIYEFLIDPDFSPCGGQISFNLGSKSCVELTPAGPEETDLFSIPVGQPGAGVPTDLIIQPSTADSYVNQASVGTNYGSGTTMSVQSRLSQAQRTLAMFDLSAIPEYSVINSAALELYASSAPTSGLTLNVHRITGTWTEAGVTWTNQPAYNLAVDASLAGGTTTGWKIWNIASLVQDWVDGTSVNYGLIVKGSVENDKTALTYAFASKENTTSGNRPILRINYTPLTTMNCDYVGSGECDAVLAECAPGNTYENGQMWSGTSQSWPVLTGATGYKLYRGIQSGLQHLLTADNDSCLRYEGSDLSVDLSGDDPSGETGRLYWYIVTGKNGSGEGPAGDGRIVNSSGNCE